MTQKQDETPAVTGAQDAPPASAQTAAAGDSPIVVTHRPAAASDLDVEDKFRAQSGRVWFSGPY